MAKFKVPITDYVAPRRLCMRKRFSPTLRIVICLQLTGESALQGKDRRCRCLARFSYRHVFQGFHPPAEEVQRDCPVRSRI